jgi:prepilin-type N-terminal cleavage/methylation domain-containing protein
MTAAETSKAKRHGFTIVELSVVLVIIGLLIGGILIGRDLIRASELQSIISDKEKFVTAIYTFQTKYNAFPGDMRDAQTFWGAAASCTTAQTTKATCNGDGDTSIERGYGSGTIGNEIFLFWKHLANAELIPGNFTGVTDGTKTYSTSKNNAPSGQIAGSLWYIEDWGIQSGSLWAFNGEYRNSFEYGLPYTNNDPFTPILTAKEMWALDTKIDDGKPGMGGLVSYVAYYDDCTAKANGVTDSVAADNATAIYRTSLTSNQCVLVFRNVF